MDTPSSRTSHRRQAIPDIDSGITHLQVDHPQSPAFHEIVLDALPTTDHAYWVDSRNVASTYRLYERAHSEATLSGLQIARAFTAYQHFSLCRRLVARTTSSTGLLCLPNITSLYRDDDVPTHERDALLDAVLTGLKGLAETYDVAVLVSTAPTDELADRVATVADRELTAETTPFGCLFEGDDFETRAYPVQGGWQTTIPYWVELFGAVSDTTLVEAASEMEFAGVA
ncbi:hypothetical protein [Halosegnis marinus]|uniref:Uncharacterized protein n=1 Tax=Halosegnis marinus TaxID=3034023 RepID=A0ABD5ZST6_9EURY|nr:hypothetical protein [Halosegnis sp. DT85]